MTLTRRRLAAVALAAATAFGLRPGPPAALAGGDDPPPPAPAAGAEGGGTPEDAADGGAPPRRAGGTDDATRVVEPPLTLASALRRIESLRGMPLRGPGSLTRRADRIRDLAARALDLPEAAAASGEALFHVGELRMVVRDGAGAVAAYRAYLAGEGDLAHALAARAGVARGLAIAGDPAAAAEALAPLLADGKGQEPVVAAALATADAFVRRGDLERGAAAYAAATGLRGASYGAAVQGQVETLAALGRVAEARAAAVAAGAVDGITPLERARVDALVFRVDMIGKPLPPLTIPRWATGAAPKPEEMAGRVVVWHVFAPWLESRLEELDRWIAEATAARERGLLLLPITRTAGWMPGEPTMDRTRRTPAEEAADVERLLRDRGWKGNAGTAYGTTALEPLAIRGLPMDVIVGRDGRVAYVRASGEVGIELALAAARRALAEPVPPSPPTSGTAGAPHPSAPEGPPRERRGGDAPAEQDRPSDDGSERQ